MNIRASAGPRARRSGPYKVPHLYIIPFPPPLSGGVADLDGPVQPPGAPPDLFRPRRPPPRVRMQADGAPRVDDGCPYAGRLTVRRPHHVPVAPRFRHGVERVDVRLREGPGGGRLRPVPDLSLTHA